MLREPFSPDWLTRQSPRQRAALMPDETMMMNFRKLLSTTFLALCFALPMAACDEGDDGDDEAAENADNADNADTEDTNSQDYTCELFCEAFITNCLQTGDSTEFETNDACLAACGAWDQAGINCRYDQITADACGEAGNMGSTCG